MEGLNAGLRRSGRSYNISVTRFRLLLLIVSFAVPAWPQAQVEEPPEEDVNPREQTEYVLNPIQAEKEIRVGNYYLKKGSYKAAVRRYQEAVKWDPNSAEGWYKMGEAHRKMKNPAAAREAWTKYLEIEPDGKHANSVKKHINEKS
jgi:predicted TPR repeat methyltransferase